MPGFTLHAFNKNYLWSKTIRMNYKYYWTPQYLRSELLVFPLVCLFSLSLVVFFFFCMYPILICFNHFKLFLAYLTFLSLTGTFKRPCLPSTWQSRWLTSHSSLCETYNSDELSNLSPKNYVIGIEIWFLLLHA